MNRQPSSRRRDHASPIAAILVAAVVLDGCSCLSWPASFWNGYQPACLAEHHGSQGPWGGVRELRWAACDGFLFTRPDARRFAERNGWRLVDEVDVAAGEVEEGRTWPHFLALPSTVMRFETGWIREDPGTGESAEAVGYVQVARDGSALYVFHFWGNG